MLRLLPLFLLTTVASVTLPASSDEPPPIKLFVREDGVYRVSYEELAEVGWPAGVATDRLALSQRGNAVPLAIRDGGDGQFGPGDSLAFIGEHLAGEHGYYNEFTAFHVYRLAVAAPGAGRRFVPLAAGAVAAGATPPSWQSRSRLEQDRLLLRYPNQGIGDDDLWYWAKLSQIDAEPFEVVVDLADLAPGEAAVRITAELRGWSRPASKPDPSFADHHVELLWDGEVVATREWNGFDRPIRIVAADLPPALVTPGTHRLGLRVPARPANANGDPLVDVVVLNWVEVVAPVDDRLAAVGARRLEPIDLAPADRLHPSADGVSGANSDQPAEPSPAPMPRRVLVPAGRSVELFTPAGEHLVVPPTAAGDRVLGLTGVPPESTIWVVGDGDFAAVAGLERDTPSALRATDQQADYLIVAHPRLLEAVRPLAAAHRRRGLNVALIDVRDVYDEWSHGIVSPLALRDFVAHAFHSWAQPAPRFLLLVGDASWDAKNDQAFDESPDWAFQVSDRAAFIKNGSTPYGASSARNLMPTWDYGTHEGHAAGDNGFVTVAGDDELPDLAVGRFPVVEPDEVAAIVAKTVAYLESPPPGDWRQRVLWVTNEEPYWQGASDRLAATLAERGFTAQKVYPPAELPAVAGEDQVVLRGAFDQGALLVHFVGHGGRYIWRTGPPDLATQRDLFDLADVERLTPGDRLPLVLSLTCYSAPFDHPTADSIGEKLLRQPQRGAVGVFAASWRNSPAEAWSRQLVDELLVPGTVGEALMRAKRAVRSPDFVRQYNLLGDPALVLAVPPGLAAAAGKEAVR